jgi:hypothetical protein
VFFYMGTIGVLSMLVAYIVVNLGAMRFLHLGRREALWRVTIPILAIAALVYVIYKNVWPEAGVPVRQLPAHGRRMAPARDRHHAVYPGLARRVGIGLSKAEGIKAPDDEEGASSDA